MAAAGPIITMLTDFGLKDWYVPAVKSILLQRCPKARLIDITHEIPPGDIRLGSIMLERAVASFPPGAIHLAVVDPTVGSRRRLLIVSIHGQTVICPDNGLITWSLQRLGAAATYELVWRPDHSSHTFHARDILAPAAGMIASDVPLSSLAAPIGDPVLLPALTVAAKLADARVIQIDHFGNATSNLPAALARDAGLFFSIHSRPLGPLRNTYADVSPGQPLALIGSADLLEIACRDASAEDMLKLKIGDAIRITREAP